MIRNVDAAKLISKTLEDNHKEYLEDLNLLDIFSEIFKLGFPQIDENRLIAFIIFAYDPDSQKLNIQKDRYENKHNILQGLGADADNDLMQEILTNSNEKFNIVVLKYLETLTNWRWQTIYALLDYHSNMIRYANQKTEAEKSWDKMNKEGETVTLTKDYDIDLISKVNIQKSDLLKRAISAREDADKLLNEIKKDFMPTDNATQADFNFTFSDTAKTKIDIMSWRTHVIKKNEQKGNTL